jgi:hypothetical protein
MAAKMLGLLSVKLGETGRYGQNKRIIVRDRKALPRINNIGGSIVNRCQQAIRHLSVAATFLLFPILSLTRSPLGGAFVLQNRWWSHLFPMAELQSEFKHQTFSA